jgi:hypothetical protein
MYYEVSSARISSPSLPEPLDGEPSSRGCQMAFIAASLRGRAPRYIGLDIDGFVIPYL